MESVERTWKKTVLGTAIATLFLIGLLCYFWLQPAPDLESIRTLLLFVLLMPVALGICYLIKRLIESLAD